MATRDIVQYLKGEINSLPEGHAGAPLMATLIGELLSRGYRVSVFTTSADMSLLNSRAIEAGIGQLKIYYIPARPKAWMPNGRRLGRVVDLFAFERQGLQKAITSVSPDVIHAHWAYEYAWAAINTGLPHVVTSHDSPIRIAKFYKNSGLKYSLYRWLRAGMARYVFSRAKCVTTVSPYMVGEIQSFCKVVVDVIPNPLSSQIFERSKKSNLASVKKILMVANGWDAHKNSVTALHAFAKLSALMPLVELHVFGHDHGERESASKWWCSQGFQGRIRFHGSVSHQRILDEMTDADVLLHCSLEESFGAVIAEAMAIGLPVVAGENSGAVPWVVGNDGVLVDVTNADAIAVVLENLLGSAERLQELSEASRKSMAERFSVHRVVDAYLDQYKKEMLHRETVA